MVQPLQKRVSPHLGWSKTSGKLYLWIPAITFSVLGMPSKEVQHAKWNLRTGRPSSGRQCCLKAPHVAGKSTVTLQQLAPVEGSKRGALTLGFLSFILRTQRWICFRICSGEWQTNARLLVTNGSHPSELAATRALCVKWNRCSKSTVQAMRSSQAALRSVNPRP